MNKNVEFSQKLCKIEFLKIVQSANFLQEMSKIANFLPEFCKMAFATNLVQRTNLL